MRPSSTTGGKKSDFVYDSVGNDTFPGSLNCLRPLGVFVSFSVVGADPPLNISLLSQKGLLFATWPRLFAYNAKREDMVRSAEALFDVVLKSDVDIRINQRFALRDAMQVYAYLEGRKTKGMTVFIA